MLGIVEHEQETTAAQMACQLIADRDAWRLGDPECPGDGRKHELCVGERGQCDEEDTVGEVLEEFGGDVCSEPRLSCPSRTGQRHESDIGAREQGRQLADLPLAADERRGLKREVRRPLIESDGPEGTRPRQARREQLEQAPRRREGR